MTDRRRRHHRSDFRRRWEGHATDLRKLLLRRPHSWLELAIELIFAATLGFAPFAFGAVEAWSEQVLLAAVTAMMLLLALRFLLEADARPVWTWAYLPMLAVLLLAVLQLVPLPASWVAAISPHTAALRHQLLADLPDGDAAALHRFPLTFYPLATQHDLRMLLIAAAVFFIVLHLYRSSRRIQRLLWLVVIVGAAVTLLALAQDLTAAKRVYWVGPPGRGKANAGPFIHYSHFGQYLNLAIGAALALLLLNLHRAVGRHRGGGRGSVRLSARRFLRQWRQPEWLVLWALAVFIVLASLALFLSMSRSAMIGMFAGFIACTLCLARAKGLPGRGWVMVPVLLAIICPAIFLGFDATVNRLATLKSAEHYEDRLQILRDLTHAWARFPVTGTGLGTHEFVYPMFDRSRNLAVATHAENEYAQLIEEMGFPALAMLLAFGLIIAASYLRALRRADPAARLTVCGAGFALVAVAVHSFSDFGQHVPANFCLTAIMCALIVRSARSGEARAQSTHADPTAQGEPTGSAAGHLPRSEVAPAITTNLWRRAPAWAGALAGVAALALWAYPAAAAATHAEALAKRAAVLEATLSARQWQGTNDEFARLIRLAQAAVDREPDRVTARYLLCVYRWYSISRIHRDGNVVLGERGADVTADIVDELLDARRACPTYGPLYSLAGQLEGSVLGDAESSRRHVRQAFQLAQCDSGAAYCAARQDALDGQWDDSCRKFTRYLELAGSFNDVVAVYVREVRRPELAMRLAKGDRQRLSALTAALAGLPEYHALADEANAESIELLKAECARPRPSPESLSALAQYWAGQGDFERGANCYRQALQLDYARVDWHMARAAALLQLGRKPEAEHEARIALRLQPQRTDARQMIQDLSVATGSTDRAAKTE